jgi:hypothetical protein
MALAAWVQPFADSYRDSHAVAVQLARTLTREQMATPTGDEPWTVREEMLHIAASDPDFIRVLTAIVRGEAPDTSVFADIDKRNARNLSEWASRSMQEVGDELESNGLVLQGLLAQLKDEDEARQPAGVPFATKDLIAGYGQHAPYHIGQIRKAIGQG